MTALLPPKPARRPRSAAPSSLLDELAEETPALLERLDAPAPADQPLPILPLSDIAPDPQQPRRHIHQQTLDVLAADIARVGVLQPLVVRPAPDWNGYILVFGERRYRAAIQAGLTHVPAVVRRDLDDAAVLDLQWQENARREDIDDIDKALHLRRMRELRAWSWSQLADAVHLTRRHLLRMQQLAEMPPYVTALVRDRRLTPSHVYQLARVSDPVKQELLARAAVAGGWSVSRLGREILPPSTLNRREPATSSSQRELRQAASSRRSGTGGNPLEPLDLTTIADALRSRFLGPLSTEERRQVEEIAALAALLIAESRIESGADSEPGNEP